MQYHTNNTITQLPLGTTIFDCDLNIPRAAHEERESSTFKYRVWRCLSSIVFLRLSFGKAHRSLVRSALHVRSNWHSESYVLAISWSKMRSERQRLHPQILVNFKICQNPLFVQKDFYPRKLPKSIIRIYHLMGVNACLYWCTPLNALSVGI